MANKKIEVGEIYENYGQFLSTFTNFCRDNYQPLIVTCNNSRQVTILCRHGYSRPSKSSGKRTKLHYNYIGCSAKINCYKAAKSDSLKITRVDLQHNHEIGKTVFETTNAILTEPEKEVILDLHEANCKVSEIARILHSKFDKSLSSKKIRNILQKLAPNTSEDHLQLQTFLEGIEETGGDVFTEFDSAGNVSVLFITSHTMKTAYETSRPTVLQIDTSFDFDMSRYKLCGFCYLNPVTDKSEFCALAFISEETANNLRATFRSLKKMCTQIPEAFIVDKDFNEISVLKEVFGTVRILLCNFHVIKYVKNLIATAPVIVEIKSDIMANFKKMLYAGKEDVYQYSKTVFLASVKDIQVRVTSKYVSLEDQFINNWDSCKEMWVACYRKGLPTLGDNTNNRIERSFWTLKQSLHARFTTLPGIAQSIIHLVSFCDQRIAQSTTGAGLKSLRIHDTDINISALNTEASLTLNDRGCLLFHKSLKSLQKRRENMLVESDCIRENYGDEEVIYRCSLTECDCTFYCSNQSPCHHILLRRELANGSLSSVFDISLFHLRYRKTSMSSLDSFAEETDNEFPHDALKETDDSMVSTMSNREKYNLMLPVVLSIATLSSCHGTNQFMAYLNIMKELQQVIRSGTNCERYSLLDASSSENNQNTGATECIISVHASEISQGPDTLLDSAINALPQENVIQTHGNQCTVQGASETEDAAETVKGKRFDNLQFKQKIRVRGRPKRAQKQLCSFNKSRVDRVSTTSPEPKRSYTESVCENGNTCPPRKRRKLGVKKN